ncbi:MAG: universal stress protein [Prochlorotrichaceae cyanobacterium]
MFRRILVCTDLKDGLQRFVSKVAALHHIGVEHLAFVHCVPFWEEGEIPHEDEAGLAFAKACLNPALEASVPGIEVQVEVVSGIPTDWIPKLVEKYQADALILGTETRSFLSEKLFGSTTAALAQRCSLPILTLRPPIVQVYRNDELTLRCENLLREVLLPFDSLATGKCLVEQVKNLLDRQPIPHLNKCWLVAIVPTESRRLPNEYKVQEAEGYLQELKAQFSAYPITVETQVHEGEDLQDILSLLINHDISAIGVTYNWGDGLLDWPIPSFGKEIMRRSCHPVLLFPPKGH